eukprot:CAMPEP_0206005104 /NCGR_PEP_ID=MMETSP1464-20131121/4376_1 /ASSEMBLY_ACC=CAM_ASM_001124 /TAXON_ID=119497 /ORGANISM="Exanthemachrysis gayraliae, Strain RCC1523" /LENGTH=222 /DNA_ID=CAMNT_0053378529 /DNA_START=20 /DNA_END=684 /DNA_ORIENTATION=-
MAPVHDVETFAAAADPIATEAGPGGGGPMDGGVGEAGADFEAGPAPEAGVAPEAQRIDVAEAVEAALLDALVAEAVHVVAASRTFAAVVIKPKACTRHSGPPCLGMRRDAHHGRRVAVANALARHRAGMRRRAGQRRCLGRWRLQPNAKLLVQKGLGLGTGEGASRRGRERGLLLPRVPDRVAVQPCKLVGTQFILRGVRSETHDRPAGPGAHNAGPGPHTA